MFICFQVFTGISLTMTIVVITTFILETHPHCRIPYNSSENVTLDSVPFIEYREKTRPHPALYYIEIFCMIELTLETIARFVSCPMKKLFFKNPINILDLISLLSFYITSGLLIADSGYMNRQEFPLILQLLRLMRVFRIFKVATHLQALQILFHTLKASAMELLLMLMLIISLMVCFASVIYFAEQVEEVESNHFTSIPIGFWWAIVTMTTLGYGDKYPQTALGYFFGSICAICGVLFIALPIPIIVNNFSTYYTHAKAQEKLPKKKKVALVGAADALKQTMQELMIIPTAHSEVVTSEPPSIQTSPLPVEREQNRRDGSKETIKNSVDSGITLSTSGITDRSVRGINVTFTDIDDDEDVEATSKHVNGTVLCNGHSSLQSNFIPEECEEMDHRLIKRNSSYSNNLKPKRSLQPTAVSRRASLLPGGVSNTPTQGSNIIHAL